MRKVARLISVGLFCVLKNLDLNRGATDAILAKSACCLGSRVCGSFAFHVAPSSTAQKYHHRGG